MNFFLLLILYTIIFLLGINGLNSLLVKLLPT